MPARPASPEPAEDRTGAGAAIAGIVASAGRLGIEMDEMEAAEWLAAMAVESAAGDVVVDTASGVFGHRITMLDFAPAELARFRDIGRLVGFEDRPGVETALALSGSAAQSKIQAYPGDCDYFERINIHAPTRDAACAVLADLLREKALSTVRGPTYRLLEVKFGTHPRDIVLGGRTVSAGSPISWTPDAIATGALAGLDPAAGEPSTVGWAEAAADPGWCKLDWIVADPIRRRVANASNMLDVTWEAPDGRITPLDGFLDPHFQEVYLEAESLPLFAKLVRELSADALDAYVEELESEVRKYVSGEPNFGKAARRLYNVFRLTGRYADAAYVRELFDEPATVLYQVWALVRSLEEAAGPGSTIDRAMLAAQADELIIAAVGVLEGDAESAVLRQLLVLRDAIAGGTEDALPSAGIEAIREAVLAAVNEFFYIRLTAREGIREYLDELVAEDAARA